MSNTIFSHFVKPVASWICPNPTCDQPNYFSILFNAPITTSDDNRFSLLSESMQLTNESIKATSPISSNFSHLTESLAHSTSSYIASDSSPGSPQAASSLHPNSNTTRIRTIINNSLTIAIINFQSIRNKVRKYHLFLELQIQIYIVIGTESWLTPDIANSAIFPPEYAFHKERKPGNKETGGRSLQTPPSMIFTLTT